MFLVLLPSKASMDIYPRNKTSEFTVQLPKSIDLEGFWEVGLAEIQYQNSWYNIDNINVIGFIIGKILSLVLQVFQWDFIKVHVMLLINF